MDSGKVIFSIPRGFLLLFLLLGGACEHSPEIGPQPLTTSSDKVTALVTTTVRGEIRGSLPKQHLLITLLPDLGKSTTMNQLSAVLKETGPLKELAYLIEADVMFELQKPEHHHERIHFNSPEVQRQVVSAIIAGMSKALDQLKGTKNGR